MTIEYDQQEFVNEYISRQNKMISELTSKNIMLDYKDGGRSGKFVRN